jgi:hypothetical protein
MDKRRRTDITINKRRRTDITMDKRRRTDNTSKEKGQISQWTKEEGLFIFSFSFVHCVVCPSSFDVLSVLLRLICFLSFFF